MFSFNLLASKEVISPSIEKTALSFIDLYSFKSFSVIGIDEIKFFFPLIFLSSRFKKTISSVDVSILCIISFLNFLSCFIILCSIVSFSIHTLDFNSHMNPIRAISGVNSYNKSFAKLASLGHSTSILFVSTSIS